MNVTSWRPSTAPHTTNSSPLTRADAACGQTGAAAGASTPTGEQGGTFLNMLAPAPNALAERNSAADQPRPKRRAARISGALVAVVALLAAFAGGLFVGRNHVGEPSASIVEPLTASGPIGPWQRFGHSSSTHSALIAVASDPRGVLLVGDSVAARIQSAFADAMRAQGRPLSFDHWNGRPTHATADTLVAMQGSGQIPESLVVLSGENDVFEPSLFAPQIERVMRVAGEDRQVYWITPDVRRPNFIDSDIANSQRLQATLRSAAAAHPNLHLVDWAGYLDTLDQTQRLAMVPDGVHPSPAGTTVLVKDIVAAMATQGAAQQN